LDELVLDLIGDLSWSTAAWLIVQPLWAMLIRALC
jgi:hypothetical protein